MRLLSSRKFCFQLLLLLVPLLLLVLLPAFLPAQEAPGSTSSIGKTAPVKEKPNRPPDVIFVPTPQEVVDAMLKLANVHKGDVLYDLGCGDGRTVVTAAKQYGVRATGIDMSVRFISPFSED